MGELEQAKHYHQRALQIKINVLVLTKSRDGLLSVKYPSMLKVFNVEYLRMCGDINLILELSRQEHVRNVAELLLDIIEQQSVIAALCGHVLNAVA